mmetsp:Transcript_109062/g.307439  ORF Transcript_109062/g.307439 Transcript_109062/m.307439 type:complete len:222 (-) Transcript_109062:222-887(-)
MASAASRRMCSFVASSRSPRTAPCCCLCSRSAPSGCLPSPRQRLCLPQTSSPASRRWFFVTRRVGGQLSLRTRWAVHTSRHSCAHGRRSPRRRYSPTRSVSCCTGITYCLTSCTASPASSLPARWCGRKACRRRASRSACTGSSRKSPACSRASAATSGGRSTCSSRPTCRATRPSCSARVTSSCPRVRCTAISRRRVVAPLRSSDQNCCSSCTRDEITAG